MEKKNFSYDELGDSLIISNKSKEDVVVKNLMFDDFIFSVTKKGKIASLEIKNASLVLKEAGLNLDILEDIKDARLRIVPKMDSIFIGVSIETSKGVNNIPVYFSKPALIQSYQDIYF